MIPGLEGRLLAYELNAFIGRMPLFSSLDAAPAKKVALRQAMMPVPLTGTPHGWVQEHYRGEMPGFELLSAPVQQPRRTFPKDNTESLTTSIRSHRRTNSRIGRNG